MNEQALRELYLDLLKKCLLNLIYQDRPYHRYVPNVSGVNDPEYDAVYREMGQDWPREAHSMIGVLRMNNLQQCIETVLRENVPGDLIETGVWRGGATIFMAGALKAFGVTDRIIWVADSFEGLPQSNPEKYPLDNDDWTVFNYFIAVPLEVVRSNFARYELLSEQVKFLKGWFRDSLPTAPIERLAILRLDGDLYESTIDSLNNLYPKLSPGGFCIVDDHHMPNCAAAVKDYRDKFKINAPLRRIDNCAVFWRK